MEIYNYAEEPQIVQSNSAQHSLLVSSHEGLGQVLGLHLSSGQALLLQPNERRGQVSLPWPEAKTMSGQIY